MGQQLVIDSGFEVWFGRRRYVSGEVENAGEDMTYGSKPDGLAQFGCTLEIAVGFVQTAPPQCDGREGGQGIAAELSRGGFEGLSRQSSCSAEIAVEFGLHEGELVRSDAAAEIVGAVTVDGIGHASSCPRSPGGAQRLQEGGGCGCGKGRALRLVDENPPRKGYGSPGPTESRGEEGGGGDERRLIRRLSSRGLIQVEGRVVLTVGEGDVGAFQQPGRTAGKTTGRLVGEQTDGFAIAQSLRIQPFEPPEGLEGESGPPAAKVGGAEVIDGLLERGVDLDGSLEDGDGLTALTDLEVAVAEEDERLRKLLSGDACFEMLDGLAVVAPPELDAAQGEIGQERLGHHGPRLIEGAQGPVPVAEVGRGIAEIDKGLEMRTSELEDLVEGGLGDLGLAGGKSGLTDETPEFIVAWGHLPEIGEDSVDAIEITVEEGRFERVELAGKLLGGLAVVPGVGQNSGLPRTKSPYEVSSGELPIRRPLPAVGDLGSGDDPLPLEEAGNVLHPGVRDGQTVFEMPEALAESRHRRSELPDSLLEGGDPFEQVFVELFLGFEKDLVVGFNLHQRQAGHDKELLAAAPTVLETIGVGDTAELTQHRFSLRGR